ncbi:hypothetical protein PQC39_gp114 [Vibrio phage Vp_R1]|uniref:Uncharacterized protein n=1 Tax=Vibrio phage Vp_R1 TaxID=2059867 RepID=A0A2H5BQ70_9CAUD|nr:hypothetical protein PQC39_gp114 [Vibrio phage Vp_R1]AUG88478.1 hypothetical protein VPR_114 [Vibrio phage Vp_R1]
MITEYIRWGLTFLTENTKGGFLVLVALVGFNIYQINKINIGLTPIINRATTEYAYNVISYSLRDADTEVKIINAINKWKDDGWSAQLGAMRTMCSITPDRLTGLMTPDTVTKVCRITR